MKQTNYTLHDFLDIDSFGEWDDELWRACTPIDAHERDGVIDISVPFQKQKSSNEIEPDTNELQKIYVLRIAALGSNILRIMLEAGEEATRGLIPLSEMLQYDANLQPEALRLEKTQDEWFIRDTNECVRAIIDFRKPKINRWSDLLPDPKETINICFFPDGKHPVRLSDYDMFSPTRHDAFALGFIAQKKIDKGINPLVTKTLCSFKALPDECFSGTGERFAKMDLSGRTVQLRNQDGQGVNNRRTYKNIPFYLSSEHYGLFLHTASFSKFSLADHSTRSVQIMAEDPALDVFLTGGDTPEEILYGYRQITGFPTMPPLWSFGVWMSRMTYFSDEEVSDICRRLREEDYPCDVIHIDTGWFETDWLCEWKFNRERFPDSKEFISKLKASGFRVSLWQLPYISYNAAQYEEAVANQYIGKSEQNIGGSSNFSVQDYAGTIDFTYDKATQWYKGLLKNLLDMGVVCIKTDFGEDIHVEATYHAMTAGKLHNLYPLLYQKAAYEITKETTGDGIIWARAGWAGCQRYPLHWGGDAACSWDGMAGSLKGGLHLGLSGFAFWSHDVPGFHGVPNFMNSVIPDDLYIRWTQFGVFSSHLRYHGTSPREPWHFPNISHIIKQWWKLRYRLIPYIVEQSRLATTSGFPVTRAMLLHHPDDKTCRHIDDQYYFGADMLAAPVMNPENRRDIYLPEGKWVHFFSREIFKGSQWLRNVETPLDEMPVFVRFGASIPMYPEDVCCTDEMDLSKTINVIF